MHLKEFRPQLPEQRFFDMIGNSTAEYIWVVTWAGILHSIGPISVVYCFLATFLHSYLQTPRYLQYWAFAETIFYFLMYIYQRHHLQRPALHPPPISEEERKKLFDLCLNSTHDYEQYISKWFLDEPLSAIKRENVKEFYRWAFLNTHVSNPSHEDELEMYVKKLEEKMGVQFEQGMGEVKSLRLTLDKVNAFHRSLLWYMCIFVVDTLTHAYLRAHKFQFYRGSRRNSLRIMPPRFQAFIASHHSPSQDISYWYQPHTSPNELPILFLHGIGVGLYPYMEFLKELNQGRRGEDGRIGIIAVELLSISSRLAPPMLRKDEMCYQLRRILHRHGFDRFVLVSHSYGSVITTHLLKTTDVARQIAAVILVDPVSILLNQPDVAYNFTVRRPRFANEWLLWYFGSKDMGVAHTLSRTFFWAENILWREDVLNHQCIVFLGGKDSIINASKVLSYIQSETEPNGKSFSEAEGDQRCETKSPLSVVWCANLDHGQVFDLPEWRARLISEILGEARCQDRRVAI